MNSFLILPACTPTSFSGENASKIKDRKEKITLNIKDIRGRTLDNKLIYPTNQSEKKMSMTKEEIDNIDHIVLSWRYSMCIKCAMVCKGETFLMVYLGQKPAFFGP